MIRKIINLVLLTATIAMSSCTKENIEDCVRGIFLKYYFTLTPNGDNRFESDVEQMRIFVFDKDSLFYEEFDIRDPQQLLHDNEIYLPLPAGTWHITSWGGGNIDKYDFEQSYRTITMLNPTIPIFNEGLQKGVTTLAQFRMMIQYVAGAMDGELDIINRPAPLFNGKTVHIDAKVDAISSATVPITKNTNILNVKIGGISHLPTTTRAETIPNLDVYCVMRNGRYRENNQIGEYARTIKYKQPFTYPHPDTLQVAFTVMRLMEQDNTSKLVLESPILPNGKLEVNIVPAILAYYEYVNNQEGLDRWDEFDFDFNFDTYLNVSIYVNGWKVINVIPEL